MTDCILTNLATKTCVHNQKLHNYPTSLLVSTSWRPCKWCQHFGSSHHLDDATRHRDMLEFNIRHACICSQLSQGNRWTYWRQGHEKIWAWWEWMGAHWAAVQFIMGTLCYYYHLSIHATHVIPDFQGCDPFFSHSTPNLATVIPAMDHIDTHLATASQELKYSPAICASVALGKAHLNKYYDMTDSSEVYRIAMSECPSPNHFIHLWFC